MLALPLMRELASLLTDPDNTTLGEMTPYSERAGHTHHHRQGTTDHDDVGTGELALTLS